MTPGIAFLWLASLVAVGWVCFIGGCLATGAEWDDEDGDE